MTVQDMRHELKRRMPSLQGISKMKREELCRKLQKLRRLRLPRFIKNDGANSCYIDSAVFALLHRQDSGWVKQRLLRSTDGPSGGAGVRAALQKLFAALHHRGAEQRPSCTHLRRLLHKHDTASGTEWLHEQNDPTDVIATLVNLIVVKEDVEHTRRVREITKEKVVFNAPMVDIEAMLAATASKQPIHIKDLLPSRSYTLAGHAAFEEYTKAKALYVSVARNHMNTRKLGAEVVPQPFLMLRGNKGVPLELVSIVVHHGKKPTHGHYTCYFKSGADGLWWHYDDLSSGHVKIGALEDVLSHNRGYVCKNLVGLFYTMT